VFDRASLLFPDPSGGYIDRTEVLRSIVRPAAKRAELPAIVVHDLRHTASSLMASVGFSKADRDAQLGHKAPGIDATYTHTYAIDLKRKALELERVYAEESHPVAGTGAA